MGVHVSRCEGHAESIVETQVSEYRFQNVVGKLFHLLLAVFSNVWLCDSVWSGISGASFSDAQFNSWDTEMTLVDPGTKFSRRYLQNFVSQRLPRP